MATESAEYAEQTGLAGRAGNAVRAGWRAVLVGTAHQLEPGLSSLPQVADNLVDLASALTGPSGLLPEGSVRIVQDPPTAGHVLAAIAAQPACERLLFYYAGHGMNHERRLQLALPGSIDSREHRERTGLPIADVLAQLAVVPAGHRQRQIIVILDCCYAGLAARETDAADVHLLMAVGKAHMAKFDEGRRHTTFTGALLRLLREGVPDGPACLDLDTLYHRLAVELTAEDAALVPHQRTVDSSGRIPLARNQAAGTALTPQGLRRRARFAHQVGRAGRAAEAAQRLDAIVRDARTVAGVETADAFLYQSQAAAWLGETRGALETDAAIERLEKLLGSDLDDCRPADVDDARSSLTHLLATRARQVGASDG
jgi:hypothetical protein